MGRTNMAKITHKQHSLHHVTAIYKNTVGTQRRANVANGGKIASAKPSTGDMMLNQGEATSQFMPAVLTCY